LKRDSWIEAIQKNLLESMVALLSLEKLKWISSPTRTDWIESTCSIHDGKRKVQCGVSGSAACFPTVEKSTADNILTCQKQKITKITQKSQKYTKSQKRNAKRRIHEKGIEKLNRCLPTLEDK
jgi:hypothetical protein